MTPVVATLPDPSLFATGPIRRLLDALGGDGEEIRVAGGAVRNALLGLPATDVDCATTCVPQETIRRAERAGFRTIPTGVAHGTVTVLVDGQAFEVTTLRADVATDGRRAVVSFGRDFAADAQRRDFTINALFADAQGVVADYVGGLADLAARRVRFIGAPAQRIREDYLRILRLFRFHAAYGEGAIDAAALSACLSERDGLDILSRERVRAELMKILDAPRAPDMLRVMDETGFLARLLGGVVNRARYDAAFAAGAAAPGFRLALLAVECREDAERLRERLALSNEETAMLLAVASLSEWLRARRYAPEANETRRILYRLRDADAAPALIAWLAAAGGSPQSLAVVKRSLDAPLPAPPWRGADALAAGVAPGPQVGALLARAEALWLDADMPGDAASLDALWRRARDGA